MDTFVRQRRLGLKSLLRAVQIADRLKFGAIFKLRELCDFTFGRILAVRALRPSLALKIIDLTYRLKLVFKRYELALQRYFFMLSKRGRGPVQIEHSSLLLLWNLLEMDLNRRGGSGVVNNCRQCFIQLYCMLIYYFLKLLRLILLKIFNIRWSKNSVESRLILIKMRFQILKRRRGGVVG